MLPFVIFQLLRIFKEGKSFAGRGTEILLRGLLHDSVGIFRAVGMFVLSVVTDNNLTVLLVGVFKFFLVSNLVYQKEESKISPHFSF